MSPLAFIVSSVILGACAQLVLKFGAKRSADGGLWKILTRPQTIVGLALNGIAAALWILALRSVDLSYAFPWLSLNFVLVPLGAALFHGERIDRGRVVGMVAIAVGVAIVAVG